MLLVTPVTLGITAVILGIAAWCDLATRTIPDRCSIALLALGIGSRLVLEGPMAALTSAGVALLVFLGFAILHARNLIGGGDVKLIAALAAGTAPAAVPTLLFWIGLAGGILGILYLILARLLPKPALRPRAALPARIAALEANRIVRRGPMPYALAIAAGTLAAGFGA
jgi:prepilin peptidase CpaA